jgi:hypothetical protein
LLYCVAQIKEESCTSRKQVWDKHDNSRKTLVRTNNVLHKFILPSNIFFIKNIPNTLGDLTVGKPKSDVFAKTQNFDTLSEEKFETLLNTLEKESNPL